MKQSINSLVGSKLYPCIYLEDRDETLMSYSVSKVVFASVEPGDGVAVVKVGKKVMVLEDPERKGVMDVSKIKSGI